MSGGGGEKRFAKAAVWIKTLPVFFAAAAAPALVDDFEQHTLTNWLGNPTNIFVQAPSKVGISRRIETIQGTRTQVLVIHYNKQNKGGPAGMGGWCGYYTLLKFPDGRLFDGSGYEEITFWVRGQKGYENFLVGLTDHDWSHRGDSARSAEIGRYLPAGRLTTQWQKARIPLKEFFVDRKRLVSVSIIFEADLYPSRGQIGTIYMDDIAFE